MHSISFSCINTDSSNNCVIQLQTNERIKKEIVSNEASVNSCLAQCGNSFKIGFLHFENRLFLQHLSSLYVHQALHLNINGKIFLRISISNFEIWKI